MVLKSYRTELHLHTVHSACADIEMIPPLIIEEALKKGINLLAVTDHNGSGNVGAVIQAASGTGITVLPGMELQTQEEVHLLCLFDTLPQLECWQIEVDSLLPKMKNRAEFFGDQLIVDADGNFIKREERLLATSVQISLEDAILKVTGLGGLAVPAHIDRRTNGLIAMLGFVPPDAGIEALEISRLANPATVRRNLDLTGDYPILWGGDAHTLENILGLNHFVLESPSISEIRLAFKGQSGRKLEYYSMDNLPEYK